MQRLMVIFAALAASAVNPLAQEQARQEPPRAVIELFTSQGCSSCPPADRLLKDLSAHKDLITLSLPVDYWDYLGWKDTLADKSFTQRQKFYGKARGDRQVYTPQAVISGVAHVVGSDRQALENAVKAAPAPSVSVRISRQAGGLKIDIGASRIVTRAASVWLVPVLGNREVAIGRGENRGRSVTYINVARPMVKLGDWTGEAKSFELTAEQMRGLGAERVVVLLQSEQDRFPGAILGAAQLDLK